MMKTIMASCIIFILGITTACSSQSSKEESIEITISAAASMQTVLTELQDIFEKEHKNIKLLFNFGSSGALQQQIQQGAPVDMFLSASGDKFSILVEKQLIDPLYSVNLVSNELVLIQNKDSKIQLVGFDELSKDSIKRISIGTPESVPAGEYAKEAFKNLDIWNQLQKKMIFAKDVRQVLTYVETGNVDVGIVYKTDALSSKKVKAVAAVDSRSHSPIIYPLGVVNASKQKKEAIRFYEFLQSEVAKELFEKKGFIYLSDK